MPPPAGCGYRCGGSGAALVAGLVWCCSVCFFFSFIFFSFFPKGAVFAQHRMRRTFYFLVIAFKVVVLEYDR